MGIQDRDYTRNDGRSVFDGFTARTGVCMTLIIVNVAAYIVQLATRTQNAFGFGPGWFTDAFVLDGDRVLSGELWRLLTHAFLHDWRPQGITHILFNMLFLWWFGSHVEDIYGGREFLCFYLTAALLAGLAFMGAQFAQQMPLGRALGASGAISAVMVVYAMHFPRRVIYLFLVVPVPVWCFVLFQVFNDTLGLVGGSREPVAFAAHLGGALFGFLYAWNSWRVSNWLPSFAGRRRAPSRPAVRPPRIFTEIVPDEPEERPVAPATSGLVPAVSSARGSPAADRSAVDEHLEAKLDEVLEKVTRHGQSSLTDGEREILLRASEIYRKRKG